MDEGTYLHRIDISRLIDTYPLAYWDIPNAEDLSYLFLELNLSAKEIGKFIGKSATTVNKYCKQYGLIKDVQRQKECLVRQSMDKYGTTHPKKSKEVQQKLEETCLQKYGTTCVFSNSVIKDKIKETNLQKYGAEHNHQNKDVINKMKNTFLQKYGTTCSLNNEQVRLKAQDTLLQNYGVDNPAKSPIIRERMAQTNLDKYGVRYAAQCDQIREKLIATSPQRVKKCKLTMDKNHTHNISTKEQKIFMLLQQKFDVIRQYNADPRYPFNCDFYIPSRELFIEYQGSWTHGFMPYVEHDIKCIEQLQLWQSKIESKYYKNAIETWTVRDVRKRRIARENNLNWLEFFNMKSFLEWYKEQ